MTRRALSVLLAALLTGPPVGLESAPNLGKVQGTVTLEGRPLGGIDVALVEIESGSVYRTRSTVSGEFELRVAPGKYSVATESPAGLAVGRAPAVVPVRGGQVASASIELLAMPDFPQDVGVDQAAEQGFGVGAPVTINHDPVGCLLAGEFPLFEAAVAPLSSVARVRLFFKGAQSTEYFFVEFVPSEGLFVAKMPKPTLAASPVSYFIQVVATDGSEVQTPEVLADVIVDVDQCPADRKVAAVGPPGDVTVFSAATGSAVKPVGFAAGGALGIGLIALIIAGAAGIAAAITVLNPSPTPSPSPSPSPTPTIFPTPTPTPSPTPTPRPPGPGSPVKL